MNGRKPGRALARNGSGPTRTDSHEATALRATAVQMRLDGHRLADIAEAVDRDASTVSRWITAELNHRVGVAVEELRAVEEARLDELWLALRPGVRAGDVGSINAAVRVVAERARILGLRAPVRIESTSTVITLDMIEIEMARLTAKLREHGEAVPADLLAYANELPPLAIEAHPVKARVVEESEGWPDPWTTDSIDADE